MTTARELSLMSYFPNPRRVMDETFNDFRTLVRMLKSDAEVNPGALLRVSIPGSSTISNDLPLYVGWATAPVAS